MATKKKAAVVKKGDYTGMRKEADAAAVAELLKFIKYVGSTQSLSATVHYVEGLMRQYQELSKMAHAAGRTATESRNRDVDIINGKVAHQFKLLIEDHITTFKTPGG